MQNTVSACAISGEIALFANGISLAEQGSVASLVVLGALVCLCLPRALANRNIARRRRGDGKGGWIGLTQLGGARPVAED